MDLAESNAKCGNFERAAVFIGRAMPIATFVKIIEMEARWHNGKIFDSEVQQNKAKRERKPDTNQIWRKLAAEKLETGRTTEDVWPSLISILESRFDNVKGHKPNEYNPKSWYVTYDVTSDKPSREKPKQKKISYKTFANAVSRAKKSA